MNKLKLQPDYSGYGWIKVPKYTMDPTKTWEERYAELEAHHIQECTFLIAKVRELAREHNEQSPQNQGG